MPEARRAAGQVSALLSLGSNIDPATNLVRAFDELRSMLTVVGASRVFATVAIGEGPMPEFLNAAVEISTALEPERLKFEVLREVERRLGRRRTADRNAPREIDLDISLHGEVVVHDARSGVVLPDPEILLRAHVAVPLADLAPQRRHPVVGDTLAQIAARLSSGLVRPAADPEALRSRLASGGRRS